MKRNTLRILILLYSLMLFACCHTVKLPDLSNAEKISFEQFTSNLSTGDIILFHGDSEFDKVGDFAECSNWAHIGMIIKDTINNQAYIWESTIKSPVPDVSTHEGKDGPQIVRFYDRMKNDVVNKDHSGWAIRKIITTQELRRGMNDSLRTVVNKLHAKDIPGAVGVFVEIFYGRFFDKKDSERKIFCSELVALSYMQMNLLGTKPVANYYEPKDFSCQGKIKFINDSTKLDKEIYFKPEMTPELVFKVQKNDN